MVFNNNIYFCRLACIKIGFKPMIMKRLMTSIALFLGISSTYAQTFGACDCSASIGLNSTKNFSAIVWTGTGCPTSGTTSYTGNLCLSMANGSEVIMDTNFTLTGDFKIVNSGTNAIIDIPSGKTFHVTGNMGYTSNNQIDYQIDGTLTVGGTLVGNNSNGALGSGTLNAGTLNFGNSAVASTTLTYHVGTCTSTTSGFCTTVLPITLRSFSSSLKENSIQLEWSTSSEINFNYFSLERSTDGKSFNEIAQVKGHGTTNDVHNYSYEDMDPYIGRSYYRLTSNDFDGYKETFNVVSVVYHGGKKFHISPNPSDGVSVKLHFNFDADADGIITIYDNVGSIVGSYPVAESLTFANTLKSGVYLAKYSSTSFTKTERFLVK